MPSPPTPGAAADLSRLEQQQAAVADQLNALEDLLKNLQRQLEDHDARLAEFNRTQPRDKTQKGTSAGQITENLPSIRPPHSPPGKESASSSATETYLQAFSDYTSGRYDKAIAGFERFLEHHPDNEYAANAQFWIGECYYSQQNYTKAATHFVGMAEKHPQSARAPQALLNAAHAYHEMGHTGQAQQIVDFLRRRYPDSAAAETQLEF